MRKFIHRIGYWSEEAKFIMVLSLGQGKPTYMFSAQRWQISAFCLLALTTEAWRGAESRMLRKMYTLFYPDPLSLG